MNHDIIFFFFWGILFYIYSFAYNNQTAVAQLKPGIYIHYVYIFISLKLKQMFDA